MIETILYFLSFDKYPQMILSLSILLSVMLFAFILRIARMPLRFNHFISSGLAMYLFIFSITDGEDLIKLYKGLISTQRIYNHYLEKPVPMGQVNLNKIELKRDYMQFFLSFNQPQNNETLALQTAKSFIKKNLPKFCTIIKEESQRPYHHKGLYAKDAQLKRFEFLFQNPKNSDPLRLTPVNISVNMCFKKIS